MQSVFPSGFIFPLVLFLGNLDVFNIPPKGNRALSCSQESWVLGSSDPEVTEPHEVGFAPGVT